MSAHPSLCSLYPLYIYKNMYAKSDYDRHVNSFSNEGRILQIEYAMKSMNVSLCSPHKHGSTALGIKTKEGVVLVGELRVSSKLQDYGTIEKIYEVGLENWFRLIRTSELRLVGWLATPDLWSTMRVWRPRTTGSRTMRK